MGAWSLDLGTLEMNFDAAALALLGTTADEEGGTSMPLQRFMTVYSGEGNNQSILQTVVRLARSQAQFAESLRYRLKRKDGVEFEALLEFAAEVDAEGSVVGARGTLREVVAPVGLSIEQLVGLFPSALIAVERERLRIVAANAEARGVLGFTEPWVEPPLLAELCDTAEDAARVNASFARTEADLHTRELRISVTGTGEEARPVQLRARFAAEHEPAVWLVSLEDLRERQAEQQRLAEAVSSAEVAIQSNVQLVEATGVAVAHVGPTGSVQLDERWASWSGSTEGSAVDSMQAWIQQCFGVDDARALWQAVTLGERAAWPLALKWMPAGAKVRSLLVWPMWGQGSDEASSSTRRLTGLLAQDQSELVQLKTEAQRRTRHDEQVRAALAMVTGMSSEDLCQQVQLALGCSEVWLVSFTPEGPSVESAWPAFGEHDAALSEALAGLSGLAEPYAVSYAELDPLTQPIVAAEGGSAQIKSMLIVPIASGASEMRQVLVALQHDETRGWDATASVACQALAWRRQSRLYLEELTSALSARTWQNQELAESSAQLERLHREAEQLERAALVGNLLTAFSERLVNPLTALRSAGAVARVRAVEALRASLSSAAEEPWAAELEALLEGLEQPSASAHPDQDREYRDQVLRALHRLGVTEPSRETVELAEGLGEAQVTGLAEDLLMVLNEPAHRASWAAQLKVLNLLSLLSEASKQLMENVSSLRALAYIQPNEEAREVDLRSVVEHCLASLNRSAHGDSVVWDWHVVHPVWAVPSTLEYVVLAMLSEAELAHTELEPFERSMQIRAAEIGEFIHLEVSLPETANKYSSNRVLSRLAAKFGTESFGTHLELLVGASGGSLSVAAHEGLHVLRLALPLSPVNSEEASTLANLAHG